MQGVAADPLTEPAPDGWDEAIATFGHSPLWRSAMLASVAWYDKHRPLMVLVTDESGQPCALFCGRLLSLGGGLVSFHDPTRWPVVGLFEFALPPGVTRAGYAFHPDLDATSRRQALVAAESATSARLGARCAGFAYRQVDATDTETFASNGCRILAAAPQSVLHREWETFDRYLATLPTADRRELQRIRRLIEADATVRAGVESTVEPAEAAHLAHVVRERHRRSFQVTPPFPSLFFERLGQHGGARFVTYRDRAGRLLAFGSLLDEGPYLRSHAWGLRDRADGGRPNLYFDHFLREIELFVASGAGRLVMGKGMAEIKGRFGGRLEPLYTAVRLRVATPGQGRRPVVTATSHSRTASPAVVASRWVDASVAFVNRRRGLPPERHSLTGACAQCRRGQVEVIRLTSRRARLACRACGAVVSVEDLAALHPHGAGADGQVGQPERGIDAKSSELGDPRAPFVSPVMLEWCLTTTPGQGGRLDKGSIYGIWKSFDRFLASARDQLDERARYAELAARAGAPEDVPPKLPSFGELVGALHAHCYDEDEVLAAFSGTGEQTASEALAERVGCARRWLAGPGREHCWIERRPADPAVDGRSLASLLAPEAWERGLSPEEREALFRAVFGTSGGPPTGALLARFGAEALRRAVEQYVLDGSHPLRDGVLRALDGDASALSLVGGPR